MRQHVAAQAKAFPQCFTGSTPPYQMGSWELPMEIGNVPYTSSQFAVRQWGRHGAAEGQQVLRGASGGTAPAGHSAAPGEQPACLPRDCSLMAVAQPCRRCVTTTPRLWRVAP